jgi:hypothetical protein
VRKPPPLPRILCFGQHDKKTVWMNDPTNDDALSPHQHSNSRARTHGFHTHILAQQQTTKKCKWVMRPHSPSKIFFSRHLPPPRHPFCFAVRKNATHTAECGATMEKAVALPTTTTPRGCRGVRAPARPSSPFFDLLVPPRQENVIIRRRDAFFLESVLRARPDALFQHCLTHTARIIAVLRERGRKETHARAQSLRMGGVGEGAALPSHSPTLFPPTPPSIFDSPPRVVSPLPLHLPRSPLPPPPLMSRVKQCNVMCVCVCCSIGREANYRVFFLRCRELSLVSGAVLRYGGGGSCCGRRETRHVIILYLLCGILLYMAGGPSI